MIPVSRTFRQALLFYAFAVLCGFTLVRFAHSKDKTSVDNDRAHYDYVELAKAPEKARARVNPFEHDPDALAAGKKLFEQHCAECHGTTAGGGKKAPSLRADEIQQATPGTLFWILTNGVVRRGMPVWSKLPEAQRWQLVTFLKSLPPTVPVETAADIDKKHAK